MARLGRSGAGPALAVGCLALALGLAVAGLPAARGAGAPPMLFGRCSVCHIDLQEELARGAHGPAKIQCETCHGASDGHVADEHNNVKPDRLFSRKTAPALCAQCHKEQLAGARALLGEPDCLACHGAHETLAGDPPPPTVRNANLLAQAMSAEGALWKLSGGLALVRKAGTLALEAPPGPPGSAARLVLPLHPTLRHPLRFRATVFSKAADPPPRLRIELVGEGGPNAREFSLAAQPGGRAAAEAVFGGESAAQAVELELAFVNTRGGQRVEQMELRPVPFAFAQLAVCPGYFPSGGVLVRGELTLPARWRALLRGPQGVVSRAEGHGTKLELAWDGLGRRALFPWRAAREYSVELCATDDFLGETIQKRLSVVLP